MQNWPKGKKENYKINVFVCMILRQGECRVKKNFTYVQGTYGILYLESWLKSFLQQMLVCPFVKAKEKAYFIDPALQEFYDSVQIYSCSLWTNFCFSSCFIEAGKICPSSSSTTLVNFGLFSSQLSKRNHRLIYWIINYLVTLILIIYEKGKEICIHKHI